MKTTLEKITPKIAQEYLQKVDPAHQRKLIVSRAQAFAREMTAGHWFTNHQGIAFDEHGRLIDGQHRLKAVELCGVTVPMLVTRGIAAEMVNGVRLFAIDTIDAGYKRKTGEQLSLRHGVVNGARVAAATACILNWATGITKNSTPIALEILGIYPSVKKLVGFTHRCKLMTGTVVAGFAIAFKTFPQLEDIVLEAFISGENLKKGDPLLLLRNHLFHNPAYCAAHQRLHLCLVLNALKAKAFKEQIKKLHPTQSAYLFFREHQKSNVRKIRLAAGLPEIAEQERIIS